MVARALEHEAIARFASRMAARQPVAAAPWPEARRAAVAAVLRVTDRPELLFIKRAEMEGDPWSGHIAFPGGRAEPDDASLEVTAVRETREELSLELADGLIFGWLDELAPRSRALPPIIVRPFVALVPPDVTFTPSEEVAEIFWVPLDALRADAAQTEYELAVNGVVARFPAFAVNGHIVWGLTERIVRQLLTLFDDEPA